MILTIEGVVILTSGKSAKTMSNVNEEPNNSRTVSILVFDGFESLDVFGPLEIYSLVEGWNIELVGPDGTHKPVQSAQGISVVPSIGFDQLRSRGDQIDIIMVPGGRAGDKRPRG